MCMAIRFANTLPIFHWRSPSTLSGNTINCEFRPQYSALLSHSLPLSALFSFLPFPCTPPLIHLLLCCRRVVLQCETECIAQHNLISSCEINTISHLHHYRIISVFFIISTEELCTVLFCAISRFNSHTIIQYSTATKCFTRKSM